MHSHFSKSENSGNRTRLEIARDILSISSEKTRKTRIMFQANLSYELLCRYLKALISSGLLECDGKGLYGTTKQGQLFLQKYAEYAKKNRRLNEEINGSIEDRALLENMCFTYEADPK